MHRIAQNPDYLLPALRELLSRHPAAADAGPEMLARMLWMLRFVDYRPAPHEVEAALDALRDEDGGVAA